MSGSSNEAAGNALGRYVTRVMKENSLSARDVAEASGTKVTTAYVTAISNGTAASPSADRINSLALGLGVDRFELFAVACGAQTFTDDVPQEGGVARPFELLGLLSGDSVGPWLRAIVQHAARLEPTELEAVLLTVYRFILAKEDREKGEKR